MTSDPYAVLGVPRDADAATIRRAWKALAQRHHPDKNPGDADAERRFKEAADAFRVLSDPAAKARWDREQQRARRPPPPPERLARLVVEAREVLQGVDLILFDLILPAYLERLDRGAGIEMRWAMVDDLDQLRVLDFARGGTKPGMGARQRAMAIREGLRISLDPATVDEDDGPRFATLTLVKDREVQWAAIHVHLGSLADADLPSDAMRVEVLLAVWREVVRYLEQDLPPAWRILETRERLGVAAMPYGRDQARDADTRTLWIRGVRLVAVFALIAATMWTLGLLASDPPFPLQ